MRAVIYEVRITTDIIHQWEADIDELYIPDMAVSTNIRDGDFNCFKTYDGRYKKAHVLKEFEIDEILAAQLKHFVLEKNSLKDQVTRVLEDNL